MFLGAWLLSSTVAAETMYVTDQVTVGLRADTTPDAVLLGTVSTGTTLEVVERNGSFARVRDSNGVEGWVEATALVSQPPAAQQLKALRAEFDRTRAQLANTQGQLEKIRATPAIPAPGLDKIQAELAGARAQLSKVQADFKKKEEETSAAVAARDAAVNEAASLRQAAAREAAREAAAPTPVQAPRTPEPAPEVGFSLLWLGIGFAMLGIGFIGGIVWVKESIRRRMGGLYLRI